MPNTLPSHRAARLRIGLLTQEFPLLPNDDSGIGHRYRALAEGLAELGHHVHVVNVTSRDDLPAKEALPIPENYTLEVAGVRLPHIARRTLGPRWTLLRLLERMLCAWRANTILHEAVQRHSLQIVEASSFAALPLLYLRRRPRIPLVTWVATTDRQQLGQTEMRSRALRILADAESQVIRNSDALLTHTNSHRDNVCALEQIDPRRFTVIPLGIIPPLPPQPAPTKLEGRILFLYVGAFNPRKGTDVLFAALPKVLTECPNAEFLIAGRQYQSTWWTEFQAKHGSRFASRVRCPGLITRSELVALYASCDVVVAPSRYESFGLVYVEGMSFGKPVVGCDTGGIPEVVTDGITGLLARPGDSEDLAAKLLLLARDSGLRERLGAAGRRDFEARFGAKRMSELTAEFYRQALENCAASTPSAA